MTIRCWVKPWPGIWLAAIFAGSEILVQAQVAQVDLSPFLLGYLYVYVYIYNIIPGPSKSWRFVVSLGVGCFSCETRRNLTKILHQNYSKSAVASAGLADSLWQVAFAAVFFARPTLPKLSQPKTTNFTRKNPPKSVTAKNIKNLKSGKVVEWHHWK